MTDPEPLDFEAVDLSALLRPAPVPGEPGRFVLDVPHGLQQGRGAWGGVPTGAMVSAVQQVDPRTELRLRTMSAQLVAPLLAGRAHVSVESLRRGSATHTLAARILDDVGNLIAHSVVVLGAARSGPDMPDGPEWLAVDVPPALAAGPEAVPVLNVGPPLAPEFARALEFRIISGLPFTGRRDVETLGWIRPRGPVADLGAPVVTAMADAWWVAVVSALDRPRPVGTLGFALELVADPADLPREPDGRMRPLLHRGRSVSAAQGYLVETRELWSTDGRLVSWNTQTVAVIK